MNEQQQRYAVAKKAYDAAVAAEDWDLVEKIEDEHLDAESALVAWMFSVAEDSGKMPAKELALLKDRWIFPEWNGRIIDMAMRLSL